MVVVFEIRRQNAATEAPVPAAAAQLEPTPAPSATDRSKPSSASTPTATPEPHLGEWFKIASPTATPWPTMPIIPTPTIPAATRTPSLGDCLPFRWTAIQHFSGFAQVLVEIEVTNQCGRTLDANDVWFLVSGYRDGGLVQTARGHLFDELRPRGTGLVAIGLPGSIDWYDVIEVRVIP
jgi:hypothetical protein